MSRAAAGPLASLLVLAALAAPATAIDPAADLRDTGIVALEQALLDVTTLGRVMNLAAHPDDEDGATLALCRHGRGLDAIAVFANRGEGGQNEIGSGLYRELGAIREIETVRATAREGATPYFLGLEDFGYSKTADESFRRWGRTRTVERVVYAVRRLRPDVVFTNHDPDHGHGQHRALAIAMREAFDLAADDAAFPEHFDQGLSPWAVTLYLERVSAPGGNDDDAEKERIPEDQLVRLETDVIDPIRGMTYRAQAHLALQEHASQGRWTRFGAGARTWRVIRRRAEPLLPPGEDPFDAANLTRLHVFRGIETGDVPRDVQALLLHPATFAAPLPRHDDRDALARALLERRDALPALAGPLGDDLDELRARIDRAVALALGVRFETGAETRPEEGAVEVTRLVVDVPSRVILEDGVDPAAPVLERRGSRAAYLDPLWASPEYDAFDPARVDATFSTTLRHRASDLPFTVRGAASYRARPAVSVDFAPRTCIAREPAGAPIEIETLAVVRVVDPLPTAVTATLAPIDEAAPSVWTGTLPTDRPGTHLVPIRFTWDGPTGRRPSLMLRSDPGVAMLHPLNVTRLDVTVTGAPRVGVVRSYDDTLESALSDLGVPARRLSARDLAFGDLDLLDVILVDIRAYLVRDDLLRFNARLLEFVERGGTVGVFYQKTGEWNRRGDEDPGLAPLPLRVTRSRVVDETAPVTLLRPEHPLLSGPNQLGDADFAGWVHERGLYFPHESYDPAYSALLSCHDVDESPLPGGLLVAQAGAGWYVYTSYAWYRQWRAGVPGAYRFLANLVSLPTTPPPIRTDRNDGR